MNSSAGQRSNQIDVLGRPLPHLPGDSQSSDYEEISEYSNSTMADASVSSDSIELNTLDQLESYETYWPHLDLSVSSRHSAEHQTIAEGEFDALDAPYVYTL